MRGKVFALLSSLSAGLSPLGMALAGILAEILPLRAVISGAFVVVFLFFLPLLFLRSLRNFIGFDETRDAPESAFL
jgi:DHA3 family macrolide efflux protein-like MFS transporter